MAPPARRLEALEGSAEPILFPCHPRTRKLLREQGWENRLANGPLRLLDPVGHADMLCLAQNARMVLTDSGGLQKEAYFLGVPCLTVRPNTERPVTITLGSNQLVGQDPDRLRRAAARILGGQTKAGGVPPLWDGRTGERIADVLTHGRVPAERGHGSVARHEEFHVRH